MIKLNNSLILSFIMTFDEHDPSIDHYILQHDGQERKDSWYLEEVEITNMATEETVLFICNTWLSLCMADYTNKIDLQAEEKQQELEGTLTFIRINVNVCQKLI